MRINPWVIPGFPNERYPTTNITPLTYRDGVTYLEKLERLSRFIKHELMPWFNDNLESFTEEFKEIVNELVDQVNTALEGQANDVSDALEALEARVNAAIADIINNSIELQDTVMAGILANDDSETRAALDLAISEDIEAGGATRATLDELYGMGFEIKAQQGQSLAGGTGADYDAAIDNDFNGVYYYGVTPGESGYQQINPVTSLPLKGGLIEERAYGLMGDIIAARLRFIETGLPQLIVPTFAGGAGFYSHNTVAGRWLVGETVYANLASLSVAAINEAIVAGRKMFGPLYKISIMFNGGEADRDIGVQRDAFSQAAVDLVNYVRSNVNYSGDIVYVFARQLPERRVIDGRRGVGVDAAILDLPGLLELCAVAHAPYGFVSGDGTHATSAGQRQLGMEYIAAFKRAETSRSSVPAGPVENLRINEFGRVQWDPPLTGKVSNIRVYRTIDGAHTTAGDIAAGSTEYNPVVGFSNSQVGVRAFSAAGSAEIVVTDEKVSPRTTGKLFDMQADTLVRSREGVPLRGGDWMSGGGRFKDFGFSRVANTPYIRRRNNVHWVVELMEAGLATEPGYLSHSEFTLATIVNVALVAGSGSREIVGGYTAEEPFVFVNGNATTIAVRGASADTPVKLSYDFADRYVCIVLRKTSGTVKLDLISADREQSSVEGIVSNTALSQLRVGSTRDGDRIPLNATLASMLMLDWNIPDGSVPGVADEMWKRLSL